MAKPALLMPVSLKPKNNNVDEDGLILSEQLTPDNVHDSQVCCTVERTFGVLKRLYGLGKARYLGLARNQARVSLIAMANNLKRGANIQRAC